VRFVLRRNTANLFTEQLCYAHAGTYDVRWRASGLVFLQPVSLTHCIARQPVVQLQERTEGAGGSWVRVPQKWVTGQPASTLFFSIVISMPRKISRQW